MWPNESLRRSTIGSLAMKLVASLSICFLTLAIFAAVSAGQSVKQEFFKKVNILPDDFHVKHTSSVLSSKIECGSFALTHLEPGFNFDENNNTCYVGCMRYNASMFEPSSNTLEVYYSWPPGGRKVDEITFTLIWLFIVLHLRGGSCDMYTM